MGFASALSLLASGAPWRRVLAITLAVIALGVPLLMPQGSVLRAAAALYLLWTCAKVVDLCRDPMPRPAHYRVLQALVLHDLRRDGYGRGGAHPEFRLGLLASAVAGVTLGVICLHVALFEAALLPRPWGWLLRHAAGLALAYFGVEGALRSFELIYRAFGLRPPAFHQHPILSASIAEFWGRRWNRVVGSWLFSTFYRPVALGGSPRLALLCAFAASALLHLYFTWAAVGLGWGLVMASFFLLQVPLLLLEASLKAPRWPRPLRRLWTLGWLTLTSPLFVAPTLAILGAGFE